MVAFGILQDSLGGVYFGMSQNILLVAELFGSRNLPGCFQIGAAKGSLGHADAILAVHGTVVRLPY